MALREEVIEALKTHPCYNEGAHTKFARMHLPVAPKCNIQCNYCNRKYDCSNESRPGVTSEVLTPEEAVEKIREVKAKIPELKVLAIAGPGDTLANEESFRTMELVSREFPEMTLCISTNGLMLPASADRLFECGVRFVTVTMNAVDPDVSKDIYSSVLWDGKKLRGREAAERLLNNQLEGIRKCVALGMAVKINVVLIPGYNSEHIPTLVKKVKELGVFIVNILPLIPVEGTKFGDLEPPTPEERKRLLNLCENDVKMMRHCRQCRADAIGLLGEDRSGEFVRMDRCSCGSRAEPKVVIASSGSNIAVATDSGKDVDCGFGNTKRFMIFDEKGRYLRDVTVDNECSIYGQSHSAHIMNVVDSLADCGTVIVSEIGPFPRERLVSQGKRIVIAKGSIGEALKNQCGL